MCRHTEKIQHIFIQLLWDRHTITFAIFIHWNKTTGLVVVIIIFKFNHIKYIRQSEKSITLITDFSQDFFTCRRGNIYRRRHNLIQYTIAYNCQKIFGVIFSRENSRMKGVNHILNRCGFRYRIQWRFITNLF